MWVNQQRARLSTMLTRSRPTLLFYFWLLVLVNVQQVVVTADEIVQGKASLSTNDQEAIENKIKAQQFCSKVGDTSDVPCSSDLPDSPPEQSKKVISHSDETLKLKLNTQDEHDGKKDDSTGILLRKGVEDLYDRMENTGAKVMQKIEGVMDKVTHSKNRMMKKFDTVMDHVSESVYDSKDRMIEEFDKVMDKVSHSKDRMMKNIDEVMDKVSESMSDSKTRVTEGFNTVMDKMTESKDTMMKGLDDVIDKVAHSKMMEEIDHVLDSVAHSKVMEEIRALPEEIRQSFVLSARNRSYVAAGVMVAITTAILIGGALYYSWCHRDAWGYYLQPLNGDVQLMCSRHPRDSSTLVVSYKKVYKPRVNGNTGGAEEDEDISERNSPLLSSGEKVPGNGIDHKDISEESKKSRNEKDTESERENGCNHDSHEACDDTNVQTSAGLEVSHKGENLEADYDDPEHLLMNNDMIPSQDGDIQEESIASEHSANQIRHRKVLATCLGNGHGRVCQPSEEINDVSL